MTSLEDSEIRRGEELLSPAGSPSPITGALEVGREKNWDIVPVLDMLALSGPIVADAAAKDGVDGVFWLILSFRATSST